MFEEEVVAVGMQEGFEEVRSGNHSAQAIKPLSTGLGIGLRTGLGVEEDNAGDGGIFLKPVGESLAEGLGVEFKVVKGEVLECGVGVDGGVAVGTLRGRDEQMLFWWKTE